MPQNPNDIPDMPDKGVQEVVPHVFKELSAVLPPEIRHYKPEWKPGTLFAGGLTKRQVELVAFELLSRKREALNFWSPEPAQAKFHASRAFIRMLLGGNRAGKTVTGATELARCVTGQDPHHKYPKIGTAVVVGKDADALANVILPKLFFEPPFDIVRDPDTGLWRTAKPWLPWDAENKHLWKPAPPLIPRRFCDPNKDIQYVRKGLPRVAHIKGNGCEWKILFFSGEAKPKPGFEADFAWPDEELLEQRWIQELKMRLIDRQGKLIWTLTPENMSVALQDLRMAMLQGGEDIEEFTIATTDNPYLDRRAIELSMLGASDEEYDVKIRGIPRTQHHLAFPEFNPNNVEAGKEPFRCEYFPIPDHWSRYVAIDPGVNPAAAVFMAVPPPAEDKASMAFWDMEGSGYRPPENWWKYRYVYDEIYVSKCSSDILAEEMARHVGDQKIQRYLIDPEAASKTEIATGLTIGEQYRKAFKKFGLESVVQGNNFTEVGGGRGQPKVRYDTTKQWLREDRLRIMRGRAQFLEWEMKRWHFKRDAHGSLTDKLSDKNNHAIAALGYLVVFDPDYEGVKPQPRGKSVIEKLLASKLRRGRGNTSTTFGPGGVN